VASAANEPAAGEPSNYDFDAQSEF
jgi:hypothetical protein